MAAPQIDDSTEDERREFIKNTYKCIADCDLCGICQVFKGMEPETAYQDYILGKRSYLEVSEDFR